MTPVLTRTSPRVRRSLLHQNVDLHDIVSTFVCSGATKRPEAELLIRHSGVPFWCHRQNGPNREETAMKRSVVLMATAALGAALMASEPAAAFRAAGYHGRTFAGRSVAWHGAHWRGAHWRYGWRTGRGWNSGWGAGWPGYAGLGLAGFGLGWGLSNAWAGNPYPYSSAYGYGYPYGYGLGAAAAAPVAAAATVAEATTAPLVTGRSVATLQMGNYCMTPVKTCLLYQDSWVGNGCSCRVPSGRARGSVTP